MPSSRQHRRASRGCKSVCKPEICSETLNFKKSIPHHRGDMKSCPAVHWTAYKIWTTKKIYVRGTEAEIQLPLRRFPDCQCLFPNPNWLVWKGITPPKTRSNFTVCNKMQPNSMNASNEILTYLATSIASHVLKLVACTPVNRALSSKFHF